jgi:hypothetical protein
MFKLCYIFLGGKKLHTCLIRKGKIRIYNLHLLVLGSLSHAGISQKLIHLHRKTQQKHTQKREKIGHYNPLAETRSLGALYDNFFNLNLTFGMCL